MKKIIKKPIFAIPSVVLVGIISGIIVRSVTGESQIDFVVAELGNLIQEVSVTGRVEPADSVNLAFEKAGKVSSVNVDIGDSVFVGELLVRLSSADLAAQLAEAEANVKVQQAKLDELLKGTRPEEIQVQRVKVDNAKRNLITSLQDSYTKSDDAIRDKVDQFISNPQGANPQLNFSVDSQTATAIQSERHSIETVLNSWNSSLNGLVVDSDLDSYVSEAKKDLNKIQTFLEMVANALSTVTPSSSITQATIDAYRADVSTARTNVNTAATKLTVDETNLAYEQNQLTLKEAGSTPEQILAAEAQLESARASVLNYQAQISKTVIVSPIKGVVTKQEAKVGEIIAANTTVVSVISGAQFEIEANVPEADITKIEVGDIAKVTLDAYGSDILFEVAVVTIDPAEIIIDGVATYKVTFQFTHEDTRIKPGMTANIDVLTASRENVIAIPQRSVISQGDRKFVRILNEDGSTREVNVEVGLRGSDGRIEIVSGIEVGMKVVTFLPK